MKYSPVVLFAYNRVDCLVKTVEALKNNSLSSNTILYVYSDGYKDRKSQEKVEDVREYIKEVEGFEKVVLVERSENYGLARNIIDGVTEIVEKHGKAIILEDDLVTGKYFLEYMNDGLNMYENLHDVISIHGYSYFNSTALNQTYFVKNADNLGWATWKRAWRLFEADAEKLYHKIISSGKAREFDRDNAYPFTKMLKMQADGELNSWAIRWYASAFLNEKYTLYPDKSLVLHIGDGEDATNYTRQQDESDPLSVSIYNGKIQVSKIEVTEEQSVSDSYKKFLKKYKKPLYRRVINKMRIFFGV